MFAQLAVSATLFLDRPVTVNEVAEWAGQPRGSAGLTFLNAVSDFMTAREQVLSEAKALEGRMTQLLNNVEAGRSVNSVGEVQGSGGRVDVACAVMATRAQVARQLGFSLR